MKYLALALVLVVATSAFAFEKTAVQMKDDFGTEPLWNCILQYYYYIPCPTYSWFWAFRGWDPGDIIGVFFKIGDMSTGGYTACDPVNCMHLDLFRVLDFAGYGTTYPGLYTVRFDVYCADANGCPIGGSLWNSGPVETRYGWNLIYVDPDLAVCPCVIQPNYAPRFLITATMIGSDCTYPSWGMDNISTAIQYGCQLHDYGCLAALYPRPFVSHYPVMHSGYYGTGGFQYCPPYVFGDGRNDPGSLLPYGAIELAWRAYITCAGPTATEESTWGSIKGMYR